MKNVLVIAEHDGSNLNVATSKTVSCARTIPDSSIAIAVLASDPESVAVQAAALQGVSRVIKVSNAANANPMAAVLAPQVVALAENFDYVLAASTTFGKDLLPRVAALLDVQQISEIMAVESGRRFRRPVYAGNAIAVVEAPPSGKIVATIRAASFSSSPQGGNAEIVKMSLDVRIPTHTRFIGIERGSSGRPDLQSANRVVSGGRALGSAENFQHIYRLADKLGAAVGASRAAVDAGYVPNELQVGQTGKIISPDLYIAIGISGAIQHLTGIKDARTIVAINKDAEAPIFEIADIGMVGDLFSILPELEQLLSQSG